MNNDDVLWKKAGVLAAQSWKTEIEEEELSDGTPVLLASNPELPGCVAYGRNYQAAISELSEARQEYIYARLCHGFPVPKPNAGIYLTYRNSRSLLAVGFSRTHKIDIGYTHSGQSEIVASFEDVFAFSMQKTFDQLRKQNLAPGSALRLSKGENFVFDTYVGGLEQSASYILPQRYRQQNHSFSMKLQFA